MPKLREQNNEPGNPPGDTKPKNNRSRPRTIIYHNDDGSPDFESLTEEQKQKLGIGAAAATGPEEPSPEFPPEVFGSILTVLIGIEAAIVAPRMGIDQGAATRALQLPEPFRQPMMEAGARVMNKYGGALSAYADEMTLVSLIFAWQSAAFANLRSIVASQPKSDPPPPQPKHESPPIKPSAQVIEIKAEEEPYL